MKYQIYLNISEVQPTFCLRSKPKLLQGEKKSKFIGDFSEPKLHVGNCRPATDLSQPCVRKIRQRDFAKRTKAFSKLSILNKFIRYTEKKKWVE